MKQALEKINSEQNLKWPAFFSAINKELDQVEENLTKKLPAKSKLLKEVLTHIFLSGGKRLRPALSLLMAKATKGINNKHIVLSELTELIHTASLIHDDIIDSAKLRRGNQTVNNLWNDRISVISGDFLFGQASVKLGELENTEIVKVYANVLSDLCDGEIEQFTLLFDISITLEKYIEKSISKTASLFAACCKSAAILNNCNLDTIEKANNFGLNFGIAFQIVDDILDFTSNAKEIGKEVSSDLKQGIITAPTILALNSSDERAKQIKYLLETRFANKESDFDTAIRLIFELGGCDKAKSLAISYSDKAINSLDFISDLKLKASLVNITESVIGKIIQS